MTDELPPIPEIGLYQDTETGGFKPETNPLLSWAGLLAIGSKEIDTKELYFLPPEGTVLEVPIPEHQNIEVKGKTIDHWMDVHTGEIHRTKPELAPLITAVAAEVNGFIGFKDGVWDFDKPRDWLNGAISYAEGDDELSRWLHAIGHVGITALAHNARFDQSYVSHYLPKSCKLMGEWVCTQTHYRKRFNNGVQKGTSLGAACKIAGYTEDDPNHTALTDARGAHFLGNWMRTH